MPNIFSNNFLARKPIDIAMKKFAESFNENQKILDIGCGSKPYAQYFKCKYIGLDPYDKINADLIANAWSIPVSDEKFDGVILNQSLEHIEKTTETISEIKRILKPGGICIITVPHTMRNHASPIPSNKVEFNNFDKNKIKYFNVDYFRFTKFGLICIFKDFQIIKLEETSGYVGTITQMINYFFASFKPIDRLFLPIYFILNIIGYFSDKIFYLLTKINFKLYNKFYEIIYHSLTLNYVLIIKKYDK